MPASPREFVLNPAAYNLPTRDDLVKLRIWDIHYHGFFKGGIPAHEENLFYVERMGIERMLSLDIGVSPEDPLGTTSSAEQNREMREYLQQHADRVSGLIPVDPGRPARKLPQDGGMDRQRAVHRYQILRRQSEGSALQPSG